jgi:hypothetical protein
MDMVLIFLSRLPQNVNISRSGVGHHTPTSTAAPVQPGPCARWGERCSAVASSPDGVSKTPEPCPALPCNLQSAMLSPRRPHGPRVFVSVVPLPNMSTDNEYRSFCQGFEKPPTKVPRGRALVRILSCTNEGVSGFRARRPARKETHKIWNPGCIIQHLVYSRVGSDAAPPRAAAAPTCLPTKRSFCPSDPRPPCG